MSGLASGMAMTPPRDGRVPALVAAVALHAALFLAVILSPSKAPPPIGSSVPINIVSSAPFTDTRQAVQALSWSRRRQPSDRTRYSQTARTGPSA